MKIEIELQKIDKTIAPLIRASGDTNFEAIVTTETISFDSKKPSDWFNESRIKEFENKLNEEIGNENIQYKVSSIKKSI